MRYLGGELAEAPEVGMDAAWGVVCGRVGVFRTFRFYPHRLQRIQNKFSYIIVILK